MDDIEALYLLRQQKDALKNLTKPVDPKTSSENYQIVQETVFKTMTETREDIEKVSKYALQITEQLENVRELVKICSIQISEKLQYLLKNHKFHEHHQDKGKNQRSLTFHGGSYNSSGNQEPQTFHGGSYNSSGNQEHVSSSFRRPQTSVSPERNDVDLKALKQIQAMQRLAKQQQELMDFILKTEALVSNIENDAGVSESEITDFKKQMNKWCDVLETIEEQESRKREEKEAEMEAEKRRKQEKVEEERQKKEEEEQKKRQAKEANERKKREREDEKRQKKEAEERIKREQKEAERHIKEEKERKRRKIKEAEERKKKEIEEAEQRKKEEKERKEREQKETERQIKEEEVRKEREHIEAKRQKKEEEEREKREKEEADKRRKDEEERKAEEIRIKQENEKKRRDWKNWPPFIYYNTKHNSFHQEICCVIFSMPDGIQESDFSCQGSDNVEDLDKCLETNDEQLISSVITIQSKKGITELELPMRVYVPIVSHDERLLPTLKFSVNGQKWRSGKQLPEVQLPKTKGVSFVGAEIPIKEVGNIQCVAVARHTYYETEVDEKGKVFEPEVDRNIKVKFPEGAFAGKTIVATQALPWTNSDIKKASKKHKELENIKIAGSVIDISCENTTEEDSDLEMYDFGWVVDKKLQQNQSVNQETLNRCSRYIVNNLNLDENAFPLYDVFDSDFVDDLKTKETDGDKNRLILRHLHDSDCDSDFDKFLVGLKSTHPDLENKINCVKDQVCLSRKTEDTDSENNFGNDFDPDFEKKEGTICIVSKVTGKSWEVVPLEASDEHPKARFLKLPAGNDKYQFLGLVVPDNMTEGDICRAAEILEGLHCVTNVSIICRQKHTNPHDVIIECVQSENLASTMKELDIKGYNDGPPESAEFGVIDGEEIEINFESNLYLESLKYSPLRIKFYKNLKSSRFPGNLVVVSKADQGEDIAYHGYLKYSVTPGRLSSSRTGSLVLYIPKPLEELIGNFPYTIDVPVKAMAKFIAWQLTRTNLNSTKWVILAGYLTDRDSHLYHQICRNIDEKATKALQRERCEQFILYWANYHAPLELDKVEKIISSHHDPNLESEAHQFIKPYLPGKGVFSNDGLEKMAFAIAGEWESMATKLGFTNDEINAIKTSQPGAVKKTLRMLDLWRLSDSAIQKGTDLVKNFHETAKSAKCGAKLLTIISKNVN